MYLQRSKGLYLITLSIHINYISLLYTYIDVIIITFILSITDLQRKRKRGVLEQILDNMVTEKEERREEANKREARREENRLDRERRHEEQMKV